MTHIYPAHVYSEAPRAGCWWTETCDVDVGAPQDLPARCDVAVIGGGFTGLNAAITLAQHGAQVVLLEAREVGWGASGRNGGFCCLGGARSDDNDRMRARFGPDAAAQWRNTERAAVDHVAALIDRLDLDVDRHSHGETWLAHRAKDMREADRKAYQIRKDYGVDAEVLTATDLVGHGLNAGFHGAVHVPIGFALNPRKYLAGLVKTALSLGVQIQEQSPVLDIQPAAGNAWQLSLDTGQLTAAQVVIATNGYTSETIPKALAGRYIPTQSSVAVTRPLSADERAAQGWTSDQMCYDSRNLLHYFRLMPDNRMLFGMRGGLRGTPDSDARAYARLRRDFNAMFPAWRDIPFTHTWSGLVCLSPSGFPMIGPLLECPGIFCALSYHGNGVAMGSYAGDQIARQCLGQPHGVPNFVQQIPGPFPLGRYRRALLPMAYAGMTIADL